MITISKLYKSNQIYYETCETRKKRLTALLLTESSRKLYYSVKDNTVIWVVTYTLLQQGSSLGGNEQALHPENFETFAAFGSESYFGDVYGYFEIFQPQRTRQWLS